MLDKILDTLTHPALIVAALVIGTFGEVLKRLVRPVPGLPGVRGLYYVTMPMHPVTIGALAGLIPGLPTSTAFAGSISGHVLFYAGAGVLAQVGYEVMVNTIKRTLEHKEAGTALRESQVAPVPVTRPKTQRGTTPSPVAGGSDDDNGPDPAGPGMGG